MFRWLNYLASLGLYDEQDDIKNIKKLLSDNPRDKLLFVMTQALLLA